MKKHLYYISMLYVLLLKMPLVYAQEVSLFQQFNGRFDYLAIGNTMNTSENGPSSVCEILTSSSANLNLSENQSVVAAYLYWAGSGSGDFDVTLNDIAISAQRTFNNSLDENRVFFAAFSEITNIVNNQGNGTFTLSDLDLTQVIAPFCPTGTNFAGWAIIIIFEDENLPLNQVNVYDGLQSVPTSLNITLDNLNVLDNEGAKIGFLAWEGDAALAINETLSINGIPISNPPLNPVNNAFNSTNSFTNSTVLYNMDIDVYDIQNTINIGDTSAVIELTSGQDFVMINNIITVLNSQLPDATIAINDVFVNCNSFEIEVHYQVFNLNSTDVLPLDTPIAFYANNILVGQATTENDIAINNSETGIIFLDIPEELAPEFELVLSIDDDGAGNGIITELNEDNNSFTQHITLILPPEIVSLESITACNEGFEIGRFNLTEIFNQIPNASEENTTFFTTLDNSENNINALNNITEFNNSTNPQTIFIRVENALCFEIFNVDLNIENCPPRIPEGFSPNNDMLNDWFNIQGLYNIFEAHQLKIFNRYGTLIFEGDNNQRWDGFTNRGINNRGKLVPQGAYYYILNLNDPSYNLFSGWVFVNY